MDDFVLFAENKSDLWPAKIAIENFLHENLRLKLHDKKCRIYKTTHGVPFLGQVIYPTHRRLKKENILRFKKRLHKLRDQELRYKITWQQVNQSVQAWIAHTKNADTWKIRGLVLGDVVFPIRRGLRS